MKKFFALLLIFVLCAAFSGCGNEPEDPHDDSQQEAVQQEENQQDAEQEPQETVATDDGISTDLLKSGNVSSIMAAIGADNIGDFSTIAFDRNTFAEVLNAAAVDEISVEEAEKAGAPENLCEELPNDTPWWTSLSVVIGDDEAGSITLFENDKTDITTIIAGTRGSMKTAYYRNQKLYDLVRRADESELVVDDDAFEKYGSKAKESAEAVFEGSKEELGLTDIKLVRFEKAWEDKDDEGNDLALYEYEYSVGVADPEMFMLAGGMRFDYEMRVRSFNGFYGQLAVKTKDGQLLNSSLLVNDEMVYVGNSPDEVQFIKDKIETVLG